MFRKKNRVDANITNSVAELAEHLVVNGLGGSFRELAKHSSENISMDTISQLEALLHSPPAEPEAIKEMSLGLGQWMALCQFAIFELIYNMGEQSLPFIRKVAWGEYDWTQGNALELLIRFAASGVQRDLILTEFTQNFPNIREEAQLYAINPLLDDLQTDDKFNNVFAELLKIEAFKAAYDEVVDDYENSKDDTK